MNTKQNEGGMVNHVRMWVTAGVILFLAGANSVQADLVVIYSFDTNTKSPSFQLPGTSSSDPIIVDDGYTFIGFGVDPTSSGTGERYSVNANEMRFNSNDNTFDVTDDYIGFIVTNTSAGPLRLDVLTFDGDMWSPSGQPGGRDASLRVRTSNNWGSDLTITSGVTPQNYILDAQNTMKTYTVDVSMITLAQQQALSVRIYQNRAGSYDYRTAIDNIRLTYTPPKGTVISIR